LVSFTLQTAYSTRHGARSGTGSVISFQAFLSYIRDGWVWALCSGGAGIFLFLRGFRALQRKRLIRNTPASKIRSASIGRVEVSGLAAGPNAIQSPITGAPCYYYRAIAWQQQSLSRNDEWKKVAEETRHVPFYLEDNTGMVLVNPQGAEPHLHRDFCQEFSPSILSGALNLPAGVAGFAKRHSLSSDRKLKIEEYCIKPRNTLFILGTLAPNPDADLTTPLRREASTDRQSAPAPLQVPHAARSESAIGPTAPEIIHLQDAGRPTKLTAMTQQEKLAAALNRAGITNPAAWDAGKTKYPGVAAQATAAMTTSVGGAAAAAPALDPNFDLHPQTMLMKGKNDAAFLISWRSQREVVQSLGWKSTMMIWCGPALALLSLYVVLTHFGWL
jgi:hypothetical protein